MPSPNFNERKCKLEYVVLHYTGMKDAASATARLCDPASSVSAHYLIDEDGTAIQLVEETARAWHVGESCWRGNRDINSASIGIELVNPGHEFGYRPFPGIQIDVLKRLLAVLLARHSLSPQKCLLAHSDVAVIRKADPGELFPWENLAKDGFGQWPIPEKEDFRSAKTGEIAALLETVGYDTVNLQAALRAFQRHFYPQNLSGEADDETTARLRALARLAE